MNGINVKSVFIQACSVEFHSRKGEKMVPKALTLSLIFKSISLKACLYGSGDTLSMNVCYFGFKS